MSNSHSRSCYLNLVLSFCFIIGSVFMLLSLIFIKDNKEDWYIWGGVASIGFCTGLYLLHSATVHKVKSDLIKKQQAKERISKYD